jgi:hypothetical protein
VDGKGGKPDSGMGRLIRLPAPAMALLSINTYSRFASSSFSISVRFFVKYAFQAYTGIEGYFALPNLAQPSL